jgi:hypothetical protein
MLLKPLPGRLIAFVNVNWPAILATEILAPL